MVARSADSLASKIKEYLNEDITDDGMATMCSLLRTEPETRYGRNIIQKIGTSRYELYGEMSRRGKLSERGDDHAYLIRLLEKAKLVEESQRVQQIIADHHRLSNTGRPQNLPLCRASEQMSWNHRGVGDGQRSIPRVSPDHARIPRSQNPNNYFHPERYYGFERGRCGLVIIINNFTNVSANKYRKGTKEDQHKVELLFRSDRFSPYYKLGQVFRDLGGDQFRAVLDQLADELQRDDYSYNSFFLFILSHGDKKGVHGYYTDSEPPTESVLPIDEITKKFETSLPGRPKVIVIQACRGSKVDIVAVDNPAAETYDDEVNSDSPAMSPPRAADMLVANSAIDGHQSFRKQNDVPGSWFIQNLMEQLSEAHQSHLFSSHLLEILTEVQYSVSELRGRILSPDSTQGCKQEYLRQMPCFQSTLRKKFYLLPPTLPHHSNTGYAGHAADS